MNRSQQCSEQIARDRATDDEGAAVGLGRCCSHRCARTILAPVVAPAVPHLPVWRGRALVISDELHAVVDSIVLRRARLLEHASHILIPVARLLVSRVYADGEWTILSQASGTATQQQQGRA